MLGRIHSHPGLHEAHEPRVGHPCVFCSISFLFGPLRCLKNLWWAQPPHKVGVSRASNRTAEGPWAQNILLLQIIVLTQGVAVGRRFIISSCPDRLLLTDLVHIPAPPTEPRQNVQHLNSQCCSLSAQPFHPGPLQCCLPVRLH